MKPAKNAGKLIRQFEMMATASISVHLVPSAAAVSGAGSGRGSDQSSAGFDKVLAPLIQGSNALADPGGLGRSSPPPKIGGQVADPPPPKSSPGKLNKGKLNKEAQDGKPTAPSQSQDQSSKPVSKFNLASAVAVAFSLPSNSNLGKANIAEHAIASAADWNGISPSDRLIGAGTSEPFTGKLGSSAIIAGKDQKGAISAQDQAQILASSQNGSEQKSASGSQELAILDANLSQNQEGLSSIPVKLQEGPDQKLSAKFSSVNKESNFNSQDSVPVKPISSANKSDSTITEPGQDSRIQVQNSSTQEANSQIASQSNPSRQSISINDPQAAFNPTGLSASGMGARPSEVSGKKGGESLSTQSAVKGQQSEVTGSRTASSSNQGSDGGNSTGLKRSNQEIPITSKSVKEPASPNSSPLTEKAATVAKTSSQESSSVAGFGSIQVGKGMQSGTSAPVQPTDPIDLRQSTMIAKQVSERIQLLAAGRNGEQVTLQINPKDFGAITMTVNAVGKTISTLISTENSSVRHALNANRQEIESSLVQKGYSAASVSVSSQTSNHGNKEQLPNQNLSFGSQPQQGNKQGQGQPQTASQSGHANFANGASANLVPELDSHSNNSSFSKTSIDMRA